MLAIIAPMKEEMEEYIRNISTLQSNTVFELPCYIGSWKGRQLLIAQSGVGKVNAAMLTQRLINYYPISSVICQGVAGAVSNKLNIGDIVLGSLHIQHDIDVTALGFMRGQIPYSNLSEFPADNHLLEIARNACKKLKFPFVEGRIISGDKFISSVEEIRGLEKVFSAIAVDMEGAAIAQVCHHNKVPFITAKAISDRADMSASKDFSQFINSSSKKAFQLTEEIIINL